MAARKGRLRPHDYLTTYLTTLTALIAIDGLTASGAFRGMGATISDTTLATLAAGSGAVAGSHSIEVSIVNVNPDATMLVQRYINRIEREQRALM